MATVTQIASGRWVADAATVWSTGVVPQVLDDVVSNEYDLTVDDDTNEIASFERGTRCSIFAFIRLAGMVQIDLIKSISDHVAPRASPERTAVNITNRKQ